MPCANSVLLTGSAPAARIMNDKVETARFAGRHGLPFAPTAENAHEALCLAAAHGLPLIGKPRSGYGGRGVMVLRSAAEIERAFESCFDLIAQAFLDPPPNIDVLVAPFEAGLPFFFSFPEDSQHTVQVLVRPDGEISNPFGCLNKQVGGQSLQNKRCDDPELLKVGRAYARAAAAEGWRGPLNVQLKRTSEGRLAAYELNGRFGGATAARTCMGFDEVGDAVRQFLPGAAFPSVSASGCDVVQKHLRSYPLPCEGVTGLRTSGKWSRGLRQNELYC